MRGCDSRRTFPRKPSLVCRRARAPEWPAWDAREMGFDRSSSGDQIPLGGLDYVSVAVAGDVGQESFRSDGTRLFRHYVFGRRKPVAMFYQQPAWAFRSA